MSWKNVGLIFKREVRDQLRDRRTLFMVAVLPLLLYPSLGIGMMQMMVLFSEQPRTVLIIGADDLPESPPLVAHEKHRFLNSYFNNATKDAGKLFVVTDADIRDNKVERPDISALLAEEARLRQLSAELEEISSAQREWFRQPPDQRSQEFAASEKMSEVKKELAALLAGGPEIVIIVPPGFREHIAAANSRIADRLRDDVDLNYPRPQVVENSADERSRVAAQRVSEVLRNWEQRLLEDRLTSAQLPKHLPEPVKPAWLDVAEDKQLSAFVWSRMFPALLVIMAVTGAFYPAVDLAAGEKERGTMETLLICPASRTEIVLGKFFTVMLFSISTAVLNLISMGLTGKYVASVATAGPMSQIGSLQPPSLMAFAWIIILLVPLSGLFSALCLALATFARSTKEGQYYLTPLLMVTLGLTIFCLSPGIELGPFYSMMPIVGIALLLKEVLADPGSSLAIYYALPVLLTSVLYSLMALWWAIDQFASESVLFREAERFSPRLWIRHLLRDKESTPSFAEAAFCFGLLMMMQFGSMKFMMNAMAGISDPVMQSRRMMQLLAIQQLVIIASPALFMGIMLTTSFVKTFRLRWPAGKFLLLALALPVILHPLSMTLIGFLQQHFFPQLSEGVTERLQTAMSMDSPLWLTLLIFAILPGICEELCYRGFILSGFSRGRRLWLAIGLSAVTFGLMHMIPQQVFNATLLGIVLGLIAIRSGSILPCILFHILWNTLAVIHGRLGALPAAKTWGEHAIGRHLISVEAGQISYTWLTLLLAGIAAVWALRYLVRQENSEWALPGRSREEAGDESQNEPRLDSPTRWVKSGVPAP